MVGDGRRVGPARTPRAGLVGARGRSARRSQECGAMFLGVNSLDLALLLFVAAATLGGLASGFVKSLANLMGLVLGFALGSIWFPELAPFFLRWTGKAAVAGLLAFTAIALIVALVLDALGGLATRLVQLLRLQIVNRPLGILPAAVSGILICGLALALLNGFAVLERERAGSRLAGWFLQVSEPVIELLPPPWNGVPRKLPPRPIPAPDAPPLARDIEGPSVEPAALAIASRVRRARRPVVAGASCALISRRGHVVRLHRSRRGHFARLIGRAADASRGSSVASRASPTRPDRVRDVRLALTTIRHAPRIPPDGFGGGLVSTLQEVRMATKKASSSKKKSTAKSSSAKKSTGSKKGSKKK